MRTQAQKEAQKRYSDKIIQIHIKFYKDEIEEAEHFIKHCKDIDMTTQKYIKLLIHEDMKKKGY